MSAITILASVIASLVFESPIVIIEKYIFGSTKISSQNNKNEDKLMRITENSTKC